MQKTPIVGRLVGSGSRMLLCDTKAGTHKDSPRCLQTPKPQFLLRETGASIVNLVSRTLHVKLGELDYTGFAIRGNLHSNWEIRGSL